MNTAQDNFQSFRKHRILSPTCSSSPSKGAARDIRKEQSLKHALVKSPVIEKTTHEAGLTLYEILGMAELMRVAYEKGEMESMQVRLALLMSEAANLSSTVAKILEFSKLETETTTYQYFDIIALMQEVTQTVRLGIGQKPVTIMDASSPGPVMVLSDRGKVCKIMMGLISNAAKFTDRGRIALILNQDEYKIGLIITDTGRGMTAEQMNVAFASSNDRGHAGQNGHAESEPTLRTIRNLVKMLEGSITVSSKVGEGTIVEVCLPIEPSENLRESCRWMIKELPCACDSPH